MVRDNMKRKIKYFVLSFIIMIILCISNNSYAAEYEGYIFNDESAIIEDLNNLNINIDDYVHIDYDEKKAEYYLKPYVIACAPADNDVKNIYFYVYIPSGFAEPLNGFYIDCKIRYEQYKRNSGNLPKQKGVYNNTELLFEKDFGDYCKGEGKSHINNIYKYKSFVENVNNDIKHFIITVGDVVIQYNYNINGKKEYKTYNSNFKSTLDIERSFSIKNPELLTDYKLKYDGVSTLLITNDVVFNVILESTADSFKEWFTKVFVNKTYPQLWFYNFSTQIKIDRILACDIEYTQTDWSKVDGNMGVGGLYFYGSRTSKCIKHIEPDVYKYSWFDENYEFEFFKTPAKDRIDGSNEFGKYCDWVDKSLFENYEHSILFNVTTCEEEICNYVRKGNTLESYSHEGLFGDYQENSPLYSYCSKVLLNTLTYECDGQTYYASQIVDVDGPDDNDATLINPVAFVNPFQSAVTSLNKIARIVMVVVSIFICLIVLRLSLTFLGFVKKIVIPKRRR